MIKEILKKFILWFIPFISGCITVYISNSKYACVLAFIIGFISSLTINILYSLFRR